MMLTEIISYNGSTEFYPKTKVHAMLGSDAQSCPFVVKNGLLPLSTVMRRLLTGYAMYFNRKHKRHGQLFQNQYKSL